MCQCCSVCGKPLNEAQYSKDKKYKSCPRCSVLNGKEHVYFLYPDNFGITPKRSTAKHPEGPQSYCGKHRGKSNAETPCGEILCSQLQNLQNDF